MKKLALSLLLTVALAVPAYSQMTDMSAKDYDGHGQMTKMSHMGRMGDMVGMCIQHAGNLGLTDDQIAKMKFLHREMQKKQARFRADVKIAQIDLMETLDVKDFDLDKANAGVRRIADIRTAFYMEMLKSVKEMRALMTDEQFKKMRGMMFMKMGEHGRSKGMMKK